MFSLRRPYSSSSVCSYSSVLMLDSNAHLIFVPSTPEFIYSGEEAFRVDVAANSMAFMRDVCTAECLLTPILLLALIFCTP